jgi:hypothetical protein
MSKVRWRIVGEEVVSCDCAWGCPCQFNALPTNGRCEAIAAFEIRQGHHGNVPLDGVRFVRVYSWPASIPEGNRTRLTIIDDRASADPARGAITRRWEAGRPLLRDFCFGLPQCSGAYVRAAESLLASEASLQTVQLVLREQPAINGQLGQEAIADRPVIMANGAFPTKPGKRRRVTEASV